MTAGQFHLRSMTEADSRALWQVANDPAVRRWAFRSDPIPWEDHQRWMARQLEAGYPFFVVEDEQGRVAGYVRFAPDEGAAYTISIGLGESLRGRGLGADILRQACQQAVEKTGMTTILAWVKCTNVASLIAFLKAGFVPEKICNLDGVQSLRLFAIHNDGKGETPHA